VFSRKIVRWEVYASESAEQAAEAFAKAYLREGIAGQPLMLHSDNGSPMKGATMLATLQRLGVMPSFSRPSVSDDNPYSEALSRRSSTPPATLTSPPTATMRLASGSPGSSTGTTTSIVTAPCDSWHRANATAARISPS
jgi:putative transposase